MSDGPFKSLKLRAGWKALAQYADKPAFSSEEIREYYMFALEKDLTKEIIKSGLVKDIRKVFTPNVQRALFNTDKTAPLEELRAKYSGIPFAGKVIDNAQFASREGLDGDLACTTALTNALHDQSSSIVRQIEEILHRGGQFKRAHKLRSRIEGAISNDSIADLAAKSLTPKTSVVRFRPAKKTGLDDGVSL